MTTKHTYSDITTKPADPRDARIVNERRFINSLRLTRFFDLVRSEPLGYITTRQMLEGVWADINVNCVQAVQHYLNTTTTFPETPDKVTGNRRTILCTTDRTFAQVIDRMETFFYGKTTGKQTQGIQNKQGTNATPDGDIQALSNDAVLGFVKNVTMFEELLMGADSPHTFMKRFGISWKADKATSLVPNDWEPNPNGDGLPDGTVVVKDIRGWIVPKYIFPGVLYDSGHFNDDGEPLTKEEKEKWVPPDYFKNVTLVETFVLNADNRNAGENVQVDNGFTIVSDDEE